MLNRLSAAAAALLFAACAVDADTQTGSSIPFDDEFPVSAYDPLFDDAPDNATLPLEVAHKAVYPPAFSDLTRVQSPVKSQGSRGVCSIFATAALMESLYIKGNVLPNPDFSEQYLQWSAKFEANTYTDTEGSSAQANLRAISQFGIVLENVWPYESRPWGVANDAACDGAATMPTRCYTNGAPSAQVLAATKYKLPAGRYINNRSLKTQIFEKGSGVVVGFDFFYQAWNHRASTLPTSSDAWRIGAVTYPNAEDKRVSLLERAGHAVLVVGWDDNLELPTYDQHGVKIVDANGNPVMEKGFWIFKNSWGTTSFGVANPYGAGYGFLSMRYVSEYGNAYASDVPARPPVTFTATPAVAIPDALAAGISSSITVTDAGRLAQVAVTTDISHTYRGDLRVELSNGTRVVTLFNRTGGSADDLKQTFTSTAFAGDTLAGTWTLRVIDTGARDVGTLNGWTLALTPR